MFSIRECQCIFLELRLITRNVLKVDKITLTRGHFMHLHERLKYLRENNGYKQKEVASLIGVKNNTLSSYESGVRQPDFDTLIKLADIYNRSVDYLLRGYNQEKNENILIIETEKLNDNDINDIEKYVEFLKWRNNINVK